MLFSFLAGSHYRQFHLHLKAGELIYVNPKDDSEKKVYSVARLNKLKSITEKVIPLTAHWQYFELFLFDLIICNSL